MNHTETKRNQRGFTLIELSIVLVIIGLIVGGVLVGQDLIKGAEIRATISQLEKYDAAVNTFRGKYNGLPGDVSNCTSFFTAAQCPNNGTQGNGILEDDNGARLEVSGEVAAFYLHLSLANFINESVTAVTAIDSSTTTTVADALPAAKLGSGNFVMTYTGSTALTQPGLAGVNLYRVASVTALTNAAPTTANALTPLEAFQIDTKKDDGNPNLGTVQATGDAAFNAAGDVVNTSGATACADSDASTGVYASFSNPTARNCQLLLRGSF